MPDLQSVNACRRSSFAWVRLCAQSKKRDKKAIRKDGFF